MMTKMREMSKVFIIIIALAFIGLMVFEWGMGGFTQKGENLVGEVNGKKLTLQMFQEMYQNMADEEKARTGKTTFSEEDLLRLRNQTWERFVQQTLFRQEMERLGISVSDSEIVYQIYNYPMEDFKRHPSFQTNGVFDFEKYHASFSNPNIPWRRVESIYREQIPYIKLQNIITSTARVSDQEIADAFKQRNLKATVEYLGTQVRKFNSPDIKIAAEDIQSYYDAHKEDFKKNEKRELAYVIFPIKTNAEDTAHVMEEFETIKQRLADGEDFNDLANEYSEDPKVKDNAGELGYIEKGSMGAFSEAAFNAKPGAVVGPVETSAGLHLIKVEDRKKEDGKIKVKVSHIMMKVTPAPSRVEEIESRARFFAEDAKSNGFEAQAAMDRLNLQKTPPFEERGDFIPGIGQNFAIKNFAFASRLNDVSGMYRVDQGYLIASLIAVDKAGYNTVEEVKRLIENRVRLEKAKEVARAFASAFAEQVKSGTPFKEIARSDTSKKLDYVPSQQVTFRGSVPGIGVSIPFNATAFALEVGQKSDLVETERGFYYLHLLEKSAFDSTAFAAQKSSLQTQLLNQKKAQIFNRWIADLKEQADITDNRKMYNL